MYAIVEIAGQQFKVAKDQKVFVHRLQEEEGKKVTFDTVLLLEDGSDIAVGAPAIDGAAVEAKVLRHLKGNKVIVFKKKRRKGYRKKNGHRQPLTELVIEGIVAKGAKKAVTAKAEPAATGKTEAKKETAAPKAKKEAPKAKTVDSKPKEKKEAAEDLSKHTVAELKEMAKAKGLEGYSSLKKAELIAALKKSEKK